MNIIEIENLTYSYPAAETPILQDVYKRQGNILVDHAINGLNLADNFFQSAMQIIRIHTLPHRVTSHTVRGICKIISC